MPIIGNNETFGDGNEGFSIFFEFVLTFFQEGGFGV